MIMKIGWISVNKMKKKLNGFKKRIEFLMDLYAPVLKKLADYDKGLIKKE